MSPPRTHIAPHAAFTQWPTTYDTIILSCEGVACRVAAGTESPQAAFELLEQGCYRPYFASDVWAIGQLMLKAVGGIQPPTQHQLRCSEDYVEEVTRGVIDPTKEPGQQRHLDYLSSLVTSPQAQDYADQVCSKHHASWLSNASRHVQPFSICFGSAKRSQICCTHALHSVSEHTF